jgi:hypothetical protein
MKRLPTVKFLTDRPNTMWTTIPNEGLPQALQLLWYCIHEVACFLEMTHAGPQHVLAASPETVLILRESVKSLNAAQQLEPGTVAVLLLKIARYEAGEADGLGWVQD